jgi:hypothetical protein
VRVQGPYECGDTALCVRQREAACRPLELSLRDAHALAQLFPRPPRTPDTLVAMAVLTIVKPPPCEVGGSDWYFNRHPHQGAIRHILRVSGKHLNVCWHIRCTGHPYSYGKVFWNWGKRTDPPEHQMELL